MTVLDRLLEIGVRCPCGGKIAIHEDAPEFPWWWINCELCKTTGDDYQAALDALTAWFVLTVGPIPGEVKPPDGERVLCEYATTDEWATKWRVCRITEGTAFSDGRRQDGYVRWFFIDRIPAIIRSWLESEVTT